MNKSPLTLSLLIAITIVSCKKKDIDPLAITNVSTDYKVMVVEHTATWCGPCGQNYDNFVNAHKNHPYKTTGISLHPADGISPGNSAAQTALVSYWGFMGTPSCAINIGAKTYPSSLESKIKSVINTKAKAGVGISKSITGNVMTINTKTVFFEDVSGDVNMAVYVVENDIMAGQTGRTGLTEHDHVFRGSANGNFGELVASNPVKGESIDGTYTFTAPAGTKNFQNLHVVAVIWTMSAGKPSVYINSNMD